MALKYKTFGGRVLSAVPGFERKGHFLRGDTVEFDAGNLGAAVVAGLIATGLKLLGDTVRGYIDERVARSAIKAALIEEAGLPEAMASKKAEELKVPKETLALLMQRGAETEADGIISLASKAKQLRNVAEAMAGASTTESARERRVA